MNAPPPGMNPVDWLFEPLRGMFYGDPGWAAAQAEYERRERLLNQGPPPNQPQPPQQPPNQPPQQPPGQPPVQPPVVPPVNPPVVPPINPPGNPPDAGQTPTGGPTEPPPYNPPYTYPPGPGPGMPGVTLPGNPGVGRPQGGGGGGFVPPRPPQTGPFIPTPSSTNLPTSPLPQMLSQPNQFNPQMHITQGIDAGPVWSPGKTLQGVNQIRNAPMNKTIPYLPTHAQGSAQQHLGDVTRQGRDIASLGFSRNAAQANAQQQLQSERARSGAGGLPWMNLTISDLQSDLSDQMRRGGALAQLLSSMV